MTAPDDLVIIGGGIGGLTAAYRWLQRRPTAQVRILEAASHWGGVTRSQDLGSCRVELGPDSVLRTKPAGLALINDLGLSDQLQGVAETARQSYIARGRRLVPVPEGLYLMAPGKWWPFITSPLMSWRGKLRMGLDLILPRGAESADEESLAQFVRRRLGREALQRIAQPMVSGIYTADPERLSLTATMPQFIAMEREHRSLLLAMRQRSQQQAAAARAAQTQASEQASGPRYGLFVSLAGGLQTLIDTLVNRLQQFPGATLQLNSAAESIHRDNDGLRVVSPALPQPIKTGQVIIAGPAHRAARLTGQLDSTLSAQLGQIEYAGVATLNLVYRRQDVPQLPPGAGFVVPAVDHRACIACTFASQKYQGRCPDDLVLLRAFVGGALHPTDLNAADDAMSDRVQEELTWRFGAGRPVDQLMTRWPQAMAQPTIGHQDRVAAIRQTEQDVPGLGLVGNGYEGVGMPDIIAQAERCVDRLLTVKAS